MIKIKFEVGREMALIMFKFILIYQKKKLNTDYRLLNLMFFY